MKPLAWASFGLKVVQTAVGTPASPYKLNISLTGRCNCRCSFCNIWRGPKEELSTAELQTFFEKNNGFSWIDLTGGEIFLRPDLPEILDIALETGRKLVLLHFPTNGSFPDLAVSAVKKVLAKGGVMPVVTVSLDGPPSFHDENRGRPGSFDLALETFRKLREVKGCRVFFGMTLSAGNTGLFEETQREARNRGAAVSPGDFHFNLVHLSGHYYGNEAGERPDREALGREFKRVSGKAGGFGPLGLLEKRFAEGVGFYCETGRGPIPCAALSASVFVHHTGVVYPCTIYDRPLGNLRDCDFDLSALWNLPEAETIRREAAQMKCPGCWTACETFPAIGKRLGLPLPRKARVRR